MSISLSNTDSFLNESKISQKTKNSAECDYKEINSMINQVRDEKGNISALSLSKENGSISIISNQDIWNINNRKEDSKEFLEQIEKLKQGKKKKRKNLNEEDYDDVLDENISSVKTEQIQLITNQVDFNKNNLNQLENQKKDNEKEGSPIEVSRTEPNLPHQELPQIKDFTQIVLNGIESGKFYTPNSKKKISKYDTVLSNPRLQRELDFTAPYPSGAFIINNTGANKFQNPQFYISMKSGSFVEPQHKNNQTNNTTTTKPKNHSTNKAKSKDNQSKKIIIDDILVGKEKRTTLMLRNIPNKYTLTNIVEEINSSFWGKYDYINLPIDYGRKLNLGYAFINFVDPMHIIIFYETYHNKKWTKYRSDKKMDMTYADKQGKREINSKDEQTYFAVEDKRFNFSSLTPKIEIPISHLDFFKKIYPNSVCVIEDKHGIYNDKCFVVKSMGKK